MNHVITTTTLAQAAQTVNITVLIPYKLDLAVNNYYSKWSHHFVLLLGRFNLHNHLDGIDDNPYEADSDWIKEDIIVLTWIYNTISEELYDMIRATDTTA